MSGQLKYWVERLYFRHTLLHIHTGAASYNHRFPLLATDQLHSSGWGLSAFLHSTSTEFIGSGVCDICSSPASGCHWIPKFPASCWDSNQQHRNCKLTSIILRLPRPGEYNYLTHPALKDLTFSGVACMVGLALLG